MSDSDWTPPRRWYRSLYWRIAAGFIAFLAATLVAQVALFLWLSSQRDEALPPRLLANLAALVADEIAAEASRAPEADLADLARARFDDLARPAAIVFADGRVVASSAAQPPEPLVRTTLRRLAGDDREAAWAARRPGPFGRRAPPRPGFDREGGSPGASRAIGPIPWAVAPVRVGDRVPAAVFVARGRPPGAIARELAPWLAAGLALLLVGGTALAAVAIFRPAHARLRDLESAVRRFGDGDRAARASTRGGDEVSAVAAAFNRMADEAGARESALVEADRARRQLLADVSHELRTPLTSIRGYAETLTLPGFAPPTAPGQHAVHVVGVEAQRLERIVNDLLDLARLDAGGAPLEVTPVAVRDLFTRAEERHRPDAEAAGIVLAVRIDPGAEVVPGDEVRLEQVVQNLTANAVRHALARRPCRAGGPARRRRRAVDGDRRRRRHRSRAPAARLRSLLQGRSVAGGQRRHRAGAVDRQGDRRASRRLGAGVEHAGRADHLRGPAAGVAAL